MHGSKAAQCGLVVIWRADELGQKKRPVFTSAAPRVSAAMIAG